jgi:GPH family glycoside/pentoside/hexuronide:cation symporter
MKSENQHAYPWYIMASYGSRELFGQWITAAFGFMVFFYYETVIGLDSGLAALAFIIYQIWNAVNDPMSGYLMERVQFPWEKRRGYRRMPFLFIGGFLWLVSYLLIFLGPTQNAAANQGKIFGWYVATLCLYDVFATLFDVNALSIFPEKFRNPNDRRTVQAFGTLLGIVGLVLANVIPPLFLKTGVASSYRTSAMVTAGVGVLLFALMIPGLYETQQMRTMYRHRREMIESGQVQTGFFQTLKVVFSNRRFLGKVILFFGYQVSVVMLQMSTLYIVTFLLDAAPATTSLLLGSMLVGALVTVPLWMVISKKLNNNRLLALIGGFLLMAAFIPMIFARTIPAWIASLFFFGIALGNQWFIDPPTMGDVIDDAVARTGRRDTSVYYSLQSLFYKLGQTSVAAVIGGVHIVTGFVSGAARLEDLIAKSPTPDLALMGIRIHAAVVPAGIMLVCTVLFWILYDLTPDKVAENRHKLEEMGM